MRSWGAYADGASRRSKWNSERKSVKKRPGTSAPGMLRAGGASAGAAGSREGARGPLEASGWVGPLTRLFGRPRASRLPWKKRRVLQATLEARVPEIEAARWGSSRACPSGLPGIPSALCGGALCPPWCSKAAAASSLTSLQPSQTGGRNAPLAQKQTGSRRNLCQSHVKSV